MPLPGQRLSAVVLAILFVATALPASAATLDRGAFRWTDEYGSGEFREGQVLPGRIVVRFAPGAEPARHMARGDQNFVSGNFALDQIAAQIGAEVIEPLFAPLPATARMQSTPDRDSWYIVQFDPQTSTVLEAAERFIGLDGVVSVEPDPVHEMHATLPNDPNLASQWWLRNTVGGSIRAPGAWSFTTGSPDVLVCVADSGVDWQHPDLGGTGPDYVDGVIFINSAEYNGTPNVDDDGNGRLDDIRGWDFVNGLSFGQTQQTPTQDIAIQDPDPMDYGGHGTAVAGCIAALTDNGIGIASSNWNARVLACRVGWTSNTGQGLIGMSFAAQGMDYARIMGADIYNASWGSSAFGPLVLATNAAVAAGMIIVTSAGNDNNQVADYLPSRSDVVSVAATNSSDGKSTFSSYGTWVDISAPGTGVFTTGFNVAAMGAAQHTYTSIDGTSFSSPIVCGAFALAKAYYPDDTRQELIDRVLAAVDEIDSKNVAYAGQLGSGRLNLTKLFYDGSFWPVPGMMPQMADAVQMADAGDTVAVEGGFVTRGPVLFSGAKDVRLYGGFDASFTTRDPVGNPSVFQIPVGSGTVVTITNGVGPEFVLDGFQITGGKVTSPSLAPELGFYGGGLRVFGSSPTLRNLLVNNNQAGETVGADGYGGGIAILSASPTLENVEVTGNQAMSGAGIYIHDSDPVLTNVNVHDNTAWDGAGAADPTGGGLYVRESPPLGARRAGNLTINGGTFANNSTPGPGGAIYSLDSDVVIDGVSFEGNSSIGVGAGVAVDGGSVSVSNSVFDQNTITVTGTLTKGGGLYTNGATVMVDSTEFSGNTSTFAGGAMSLGLAPSLSVTNSTVVENTATIFGGGIYVETGPANMSFIGNTVANNGGGSVGGNGMYISGGSANFESNVVAFNTGGSGTPNGLNLVGSSATFSCNLFHGNVGGNYGGVTDPTGTNDNIDADPEFCDMAMGEYTLMAASPAAVASCGHMGAQPVDCGQGTGIGDDTPPGASPARFALHQNQPNPFNPSTVIAFSTPEAGPVQLRIFDVRGRLVRSLVNEHFDAGSWTVRWDGRDDAGHSVASGAYLYELRASGQRDVRKMGLLK